MPWWLVLLLHGIEIIRRCGQRAPRNRANAPRSDRWFTCVRIPVARMRVKSADGHYFVTVTGQLRGRDLGRLERACGRALEHQRPPLTVRLAASVIDGPAKRYLERLVERGAVVLVSG